MRALAEGKIKDIKKLCNEGLKQATIAKRLGISQWVVSKHDPRKLNRTIKRLKRLL